MGLFGFGKTKKEEEIPPINELVDNKVEKYSPPPKEDGEAGDIDTSLSKEDKEEDLFDLNDFDMDQSSNSNDTSNVDLSPEKEMSEDEIKANLNVENNQESLEDTSNNENLDVDREYTFSKNSKASDKEFFITTSQFKKLLEIIDNVKLKVKYSNDLYLKLADIKSEEDVEFENLRKSYIYIEEKLYELDKTIFEE